MKQRRLSAVLFVFFSLIILASCSGGGGGGTSGGGGGTAAQAFNTSNLIELSTPQLGRDTAGTMHMLSASPVINAQGKTATRYGSCSGNCGSGAGWTFVTLDEAGAFNDDVKMAVEPGGKVHIVELLRTANTVRYATCPSNCTVAASWTSVDIDLTSNGYNTLSLPAGRALALSAAGKPRLLLTAYPGPEVLVLGCDGTCIDGSGWIVGMLTNGKASAVSLTPGEPHQAVIRLDTFSFDMVFSQCTSSCGNVVNWTTAALPAANTNFVSLVRDGSNVLHLAYLSSLAVSNDQMLYARCSGACDQAASWTTTEVLQGGAGRGGLDIALSDTGRIAIAHASVVNDTQKLSWSHCSGSCTQSASWTSTQLEAGANVSDAHPSQSGAACSSPLRFWAVGNAVQLIGSAQGGFQLSYDAASYAQCLGVQPPTSYVSGRYIRLRAQPAP